MREVIERQREAQNERADFHAGTVASTIANVNRDPKKRPEPFAPRDFMPGGRKEQKPKQQTAAEQIALAVAVTAANKGTIR